MLRDKVFKAWSNIGSEGSRGSTGGKRRWREGFPNRKERLRMIQGGLKRGRKDFE
jgi:hypothetical protein